MPDPVWIGLRRVWSYLRRLRWWLAVLAELRGETATDAAKLYVSALAAPLTALPRPDRWRDPVLLFDAALRTRDGARFRCRARTDDLWHVLPSGQGAVRRALAERLKPGGVFIDAGANIGVFTVFGARRVGPEGTVIAIEMMPDTADRLRLHLRLNGLDNVRVVEAALSDGSGGEVTASVPARLFGRASIVGGADPGEEWSEVKVRTVTLDEIADGLGAIDVIKMDIEGAEEMALSGARATLDRTGCLIFEDWGRSSDNPGALAIVAEAGLVTSRLDGNDVIGVR